MAHPPSAQRAAWLVLLAGLLLAGPASAHASLADADPSPNTRVDAAPSALEMRFSEPLEESYTRVEVIGPNGSDHAEATRIHADDRTRVTVPLAELPDGLYTVRWRTLSSADGHTRAGVHLLAVNASHTAQGSSEATPAPTGDVQAAPNVTAPASATGGPGEVTLRGLGFAGASLALGVPLFLLVARGIGLPARVQRSWSWTAIAGAGVACLASLGLLVALAARIEQPLDAATATTPGQNLLVRALTFGLAGGLIALGELGPWRSLRGTLTGTGALAAAGGLLATSLGGHAAADGIGSGLGILVDVAHQVAVAFWIGGVACLFLAMFSRPKASHAAALVERFSPLAVASVVVIVLTGTLASLDRLSSLGDLVDGLYGIALSVKILLLVPLVGLGAYHRYVLLPRLERASLMDRSLGRLARSTGVELGLMAVVLVAAGVLATASPPAPTQTVQTPYATFDDALAADAVGPFEPDVDASTLSTLDEAGARQVQVTLLTPNRTEGLDFGRQTVWLLVHDAGERAPVEDAQIQMRAWMPAHGHGTSPEQDPVHVAGGMYGGSTTWAMPGAWELRFHVTLPSGDVLRYAPTLVVGDGSAPDVADPVHSFEQDGFNLTTVVTPHPVTIGVQNLSVEVTPPEGGFPQRAEVVVNVKPPSSPYGEGKTLEMTRWREGTWSTEEPVFVEAGTWRVLVALQGKGTYVQDTFELDVEGR